MNSFMLYHIDFKYEFSTKKSYQFLTDCLFKYIFTITCTFGQLIMFNIRFKLSVTPNVDLLYI